MKISEVIADYKPSKFMPAMSCGLTTRTTNHECNLEDKQQYTSTLKWPGY